MVLTLTYFIIRGSKLFQVFYKFEYLVVVDLPYSGWVVEKHHAYLRGNALLRFIIFSKHFE